MNPRLFVYPKDIQVITGKSERYSRSCYKKIKEHYQKEEHHYVTVEELARYYGLSKEEVGRIIR